MDEDHPCWDSFPHRFMDLGDTPENRENWPQGFRWSCCEQEMDESGCRKSVHRPDRAKRVRTKGKSEKGTFEPCAPVMSFMREQTTSIDGSVDPVPNSYLDLKTRRWFKSVRSHQVENWSR